jgi:hypothetical protein
MRFTTASCCGVTKTVHNVNVKTILPCSCVMRGFKETILLSSGAKARKNQGIYNLITESTFRLCAKPVLRIYGIMLKYF